jgi:hypothetical protein
MPETPAQFTRADRGLLGHYLRELRKPATDAQGKPLPATATLAQVLEAQHERAATNFCTLIERMSGPGRYLLCALEAPALLEEALNALPALERAAFNYGFNERITPDQAAAFNAKPGATRRDIALGMLATFQQQLRIVAEEELGRQAGRPAPAQGKQVVRVPFKVAG